MQRGRHGGALSREEAVHLTQVQRVLNTSVVPLRVEVCHMQRFQKTAGNVFEEAYKVYFLPSRYKIRTPFNWDLGDACMPTECRSSPNRLRRSFAASLKQHLSLGFERRRSSFSSTSSWQKVDFWGTGSLRTVRIRSRRIGENQLSHVVRMRSARQPKEIPHSARSPTLPHLRRERQPSGGSSSRAERR